MKTNTLQKIKPIIIFNLKRFLKNKTWIITTAIFTTIIAFLYILFAVLYTKGTTLTIGLMTIVPNAIALIYIGIISLLVINQLFVQDKTTGIYGLEIRMGRKSSQIFLTKYLVQKIFIYSWIFADFILFLLFVPTIAHFDAKFLLSMSLGVFALFIFDWFFTGILYLFSLARNVKLISAFAGVMLGILVFFPIVAPAFRVFSEKNVVDQQDIALFYYKDKTQTLIQQYKDGILEHMKKDIEQLYTTDNPNGAIYEEPFNEEESSIFSFLDQGIASNTKIDEIMANKKVKDTNLTPIPVNLGYWSNSFTQQFFAVIENNFKLATSSYNDSWFNKNSPENYQSSGQLKDFLAIIETNDFLTKLKKETGVQTLKLAELKAISNLVTEEFFNYYLIKNPETHPGSSSNGIVVGTGFFQILTNKEVIETVQINEGQRLFTRILTRSVSYADINIVNSPYSIGYVWSLEDFNKNFKTNSKAKLSLNFIFNPFNAIFGGSVYSGSDSFINDTKINNSYPNGWDFFKTFSVRQIKIDYQENENTTQTIYIQVKGAQQSEKLISTGWLYGGYLIFQFVTLGITFFFNVRKPFLLKKELSNKQLKKAEKQEKEYSFQ